MRLLIIPLLLLVITGSGCAALLEPVVTNLLAPNPENKRIKSEEAKTKHAITAVKDPATTDKKAEIIRDIHNNSGGHSKPTFFSSAVSALYTAEGRRMAGLVLALLASLGVTVWRIVAARHLGLALNSTIVAGQKLRGKHKGLSEEIKNTLAREHAKAGLDRYMSKRVQRALGENKHV